MSETTTDKFKRETALTADNCMKSAYDTQPSQSVSLIEKLFLENWAADGYPKQNAKYAGYARAWFSAGYKAMGDDKAVNSSKEQAQSGIAPEAAGLEPECAQPSPAISSVIRDDAETLPDVVDFSLVQPTPHSSVTASI